MNDISKEIYETRSEITKIKQRRIPLIAEKNKLQSNLQGLNTLVRTSGRMDDDKYKGICRQQKKIKDRIAQIDLNLSEITNELRGWFDYEAELRAKVALLSESDSSTIIPDSKIIDEIKAIRNKYLDFAEDQTRVNSMRVMASQFANELTKVISSS